MILRPYQARDFHLVHQHYAQGSLRPLYASPTGSGKTVFANAVITAAVEKGGKVLFLAAKRELIHQADRRVECRHGVILSGSKRTDNEAPVQVASVQTLLNRELPIKPTLIILDECAHSTAKTHQQLLDRFPTTHVLGLTATPVRQSGLGLGDYFTSIIQGPGIKDLMDEGYLVPPVHLAPPVQNDPGLFADPVETWLKKANRVPTMAFCSSVEESRKLADRFTQVGVRAIHIDGETDDDTRDAIPAMMESGEIEVVTNYAIYIEGLDVPCIACVILDRRTSSLAVYLQAGGRGLRSHRGKKSCLILDHGSNIRAHGRYDQNRVWQLTKGRDVIAGPSTPDVDDKITVCPKCYTVAPPQATHCACGYKFFKKPKKSYKHKPGTLELHHDNGDVTMISQDKQRADFERFLWQQRNGRKKDGSPFSPRYAGFRFFQQFGIWPPREWER